MRKHHVIHESHDDYRFRGIANRERKNMGYTLFIGIGMIIFGFVAFSFNFWIGITLLVFGGFLAYFGIKDNNKITHMEDNRRAGKYPSRKDLQKLGMGDY